MKVRASTVYEFCLPSTATSRSLAKKEGCSIGYLIRATQQVTDLRVPRAGSRMRRKNQGTWSKIIFKQSFLTNKKQQQKTTNKEVKELTQPCQMTNQDSREEGARNIMERVFLKVNNR